MIDLQLERRHHASSSVPVVLHPGLGISAPPSVALASTMAEFVPHSELAAWTSQALQVARTGALDRLRTDILDDLLEMINRFKLTARGLIGRAHPLISLPHLVLRRICSHLNALETLILSHTCQTLRAALLKMPLAWSKIPMSSLDTPAWIAHALPSEILEMCAERGAPSPLNLSIALTRDLFPQQANVLTRHAYRLEVLHMTLLDGNAGQPGMLWSSLLQQAIGEPAPRLSTLHLSYHLGPDRFHTPIEPLILWSLFGGVAPSLQRVKLVSVRLSPIIDCSVFQNITVFAYDPGAEVSADDWRVLAMMPKLETFLWRGRVPELPPGPGGIASRVSPSLRQLFLSCKGDDFAALRDVLPVDQLAELWIMASSHDACAGLADLYPSVQGISVSCGSMGLKSLLHVVGPQGTTDIMFATQSPNVFCEALLEPFLSITWITIHEHILDNDLTGTPPALPAVTVLTVVLASPDDHSAVKRGAIVAFFGQWGAGLAATDLEEPWSLPSLREIRITSQPGEVGRGKHSASIALEDVAGWIRRGVIIEPQARKLQAVVISGASIVDHDFCAAWQQIMSLAESLELFEQPDTRHYTSAGDRDFRSRASSLIGGGWVF